MTKNIFKWASIVLVVLSIVMLFTGWLAVADKDARKKLKNTIKEAEKELDIDKEEIEEYQESLDDYGVDINVKKILKMAKKTIKAMKDGKLSPAEVASTGPAMIKLADTVKEADSLSFFMGNDYDELMDSVEKTKTSMVALIVLFYITLIAGVVVVVLHVADNKLPGVSVAVLNIIWWIVMGVSVISINSYAEEELSVDEKIVGITGSPFFGLLFSVAACALWILKDKIADVKRFTVSSSPNNTVVVEGKVCPKCGKSLGEGALFCPNCGTKFEEQVSETKEEPNSDGDGYICPNCGTKCTDDTVFCPNCGTKRE